MSDAQKQPIWVTDTAGDHVYVEEQDGPLVATIAPRWAEDSDEEVTDADYARYQRAVRLMVSAPELLAALNNALEASSIAETARLKAEAALDDALDVAVWLTGMGDLHQYEGWPAMREKLNRALAARYLPPDSVETSVSA